MYQYLSIDPKKNCHAHFNAHKLKNRKYERGYLKNDQRQSWDFRFRFRSLIRRASLLREYATPTLKPTNRENL